MLLLENNKRISQFSPSSGILRDGLVDLRIAMEPPWLTLVDEPLHMVSGSKSGFSFWNSWFRLKWVSSNKNPTTEIRLLKALEIGDGETTWSALEGFEHV